MKAYTIYKLVLRYKNTAPLNTCGHFLIFMLSSVSVSFHIICKDLRNYLARQVTFALYNAFHVILISVIDAC